MSGNVMDSYLVKLGTLVDVSSFNKFNGILKQSENAVLNFTKGTAMGFAKFELSAVGAISSIGIGLIGLADKTAMADQQYRLFGMRMLMTKDSARAMQMATDMLGASLDEIAYDPELNKRFQYLYEQNIKLGKALGPGFDSSMIAIRGLRTQYNFFGKELEVLAMGSVSKLFTKLGYGSGDLQNDLDHLGDQIMTNIPKWSDEVSDYLVPAWNGFKIVMKDTGSIVKTFAGDFTYMIGTLSGDKSIEDTTFKWENFAKAIEHVVSGLTKTVLWSGLALKGAGHAGMAMWKEMEGSLRNQFGETPEGDKNLADADKDAEAFTHDLHGIFNKKYRTGLDFSSINDFYNQSAQSDKVPDSLKSAMSNPNFLKILHGIAMVESGDRQFDINGRPVLGQPNPTGEIAVGRYQMFPSTAKKYGVDPYSDKGNAQGAEMYLYDLLNKFHGNVRAALAEYGGFKSKSPDDYISKIEKYGFNSGYEPTSNGVTINGGIHVTVPPGTHPDDVKRIITDSMTDLLSKVSRNNMAQTAAGAYF